MAAQNLREGNVGLGMRNVGFVNVIYRTRTSASVNAGDRLDCGSMARASGVKEYLVVNYTVVSRVHKLIGMGGMGIIFIVGNHKSHFVATQQYDIRRTVTARVPTLGSWACSQLRRARGHGDQHTQQQHQHQSDGFFFFLFYRRRLLRRHIPMLL